MNGQGAILGAVNGGFGGAASGLAMSNPYSAAAMVAGQAIGATLGGPDPNQTSSNAPFNPFTVDNSGWSVNFGSGSASATANPVSTLAQGLAQGVGAAPYAMGAALNNPLVLLALLALVVVVVKHK